jgi:phosphatidylserine decarboxylase
MEFMSNKLSVTYYVRSSDKFVTEKVYASDILFWMYNTRLGHLVSNLFMKRKFISRLYGWYHRQGWSRRKIKPFAEVMQVNTDDLCCSLEDFATFNDFFVREIDLSKRPIHTDLQTCIAPADGKVLAYQSITDDTPFRIKRSMFNLQGFVRDRVIAEEFSGGSMVVSRLSFADYHHFHFPDSGLPGESVSIQGAYHAGGPYARTTLVPFYTENHRMRTSFDSDHFGRILIIEVGALTVGSIQQRYQPGVRVPKAARKGYFELGGSTVVLLFTKGAIELDKDLCVNTESEIETYVRFGDSIGKVP